MCASGLAFISHWNWQDAEETLPLHLCLPLEEQRGCLAMEYYGLHRKLLVAEKTQQQYKELGIPMGGSPQTRANRRRQNATAVLQQELHCDSIRAQMATVQEQIAAL